MTETETKWSERVREWRGSGKSAEEFAEGRGFKGSTLQFWASTLRKAERASGAAGQSPVRIVRVLPRATAPESSIEIAVGKARLVVRAGFDATLLRQLVDALGCSS